MMDCGRNKPNLIAFGSAMGGAARMITEK